VNARELKMSPAALVLEQSRQLAARKQHDKRVRVKAAPRRKAERVEKADAAAVSSAIRARVFARAGGVCELCRSRHASEWHHVLSGPERKRHESEETTLALCFDCHREWHRGNPDCYRDALELAIRHGWRDARIAIERRLAKVAA
jgi:hypothetical protein